MSPLTCLLPSCSHTGGQQALRQPDLALAPGGPQTVLGEALWVEVGKVEPPGTKSGGSIHMFPAA